MRRAAPIVLVIVLAATFLVGWAPGWSDSLSKDVRRPEPKVVDVGDFRTPNRSDAQAIQAAVNAASADRTVVFPPGVYELDRPIRFASHVNYVAAPGGQVVLRSASSSGVTITHDADQPLRDVTIGGLTFDNVRLELLGTEDYETIEDVTLRDCVFRNGRPSREWGTTYVMLRHTTGVTVDGCQFLRDRDHPGRGVAADTTRLTVIKDSHFGTTPDLEDDVRNGYFRTAINIWGHDLDTGQGNDEVVVDGNIWRRTPGIGAPEGCLFCQDHGLYAWGSRRLSIVGNQADGWDATPAGGSMKLRNQHDTYVVGNQLSSSGIYTYVYESEIMPEVFQRVSIRGNAIDMRGAAGCRHYCGVTYWRGAGVGSSTAERDVFIGGNSFVSGGLISVSSAQGPAFCVEDNLSADLATHLDPVKTSGCGASPPWEEPFAGVHRGDFDGDGDEDFIHLVREEDREPYWRAHLSEGFGVRIERWSANLGDAALTTRFGVHVGDFDGDGRDDIAYAGRCAEKEPCWRVSRSVDGGLSQPRGWADLRGVTGETTNLGVHVGDFDGDGRDDLLSRGGCGAGERCWRLLRSDGESFQPQSAGDGAVWGPDTARLGLLIGDYDGDDRDDVAYRGTCGSDGEPCFRVHLSGPDGFTVKSWGDDAWPAGDGLTAHFGLRVGDTDGDGRDDIGYLGRCGSDPVPQWRHHISTGSGFAVRCSPEAKIG